jgi:hypothetical protein
MATPTKTSSSTAKAVVPKSGSRSPKIVPTKSTSARSSTSAKTPIRYEQPKPGKLFFAMLILFPALLALEFLLAQLNTITHGSLAKPTYFTMPFFGAVTPIRLIFLACVIGIYWAMIRFNIIPRPRPIPQTAPATNGAKSATSASKATSATNIKATSGKNSVVATKGTNTRPLTVGRPKTTTKTGETEMVGPKSKGSSAASGDDDELYAQVKARLRAQTRKRGKR